MDGLEKTVFIKMLLLIALLSAQSLYSQPRPLDFRFDHLTVNEGLSHSDAMAVIQDKQGFIWIGTNKGMDRFDGTRIKNYSFDVENPKSLSGNRVRALHIDEAGTLYAGGENCGLNEYNLAKDHFYPIDPTLFDKFYSPAAKALSKASVTAIATDRLGQVWVGTVSHGLFIIQKDSAGHYVSLRRFFLNSDLPNIAINDVKADKTGRIWIGSSNLGLFLAKPKIVLSDRHSGYLEKIALPSEKAEVLYFDAHGNLWVGANDRIFFARANLLDSLTTKDFQNINDAQEFTGLSALLLDSFGRLWIGTSYGLYVLQNDQTKPMEGKEAPFENAALALFEPQDGNPFAISSSRIHNLFEDKFKTIWIAASSGGINKVDLLAKKFGHIRRQTQGSASIPSNYINTIYKEEDKDLLWIGTRNGFSAYNLKTQKSRNYLSKEKGGDVTGIDVSSILEDGAGTLWIGTWNRGFFLLNKGRESEEIEHYDLRSRNEMQLNNSMTNFAEDKFGSIWVATAELGLKKYSRDGELLKSFNQNNSTIPTSNLSTLFYDTATSILWTGTQNAGLLKIKVERDTIALLRQFKHDPHDSLSLGINYVWPILKDSSGDFWIGTIGAGLHKLTKDSTGEEVIVRYRQWLPESDVESILEDDYGNLWIGGAGLFKFNLKTKTYLKYDVQDGLQSNSFKVGAVCKAKDGTMYFGGINGINFFDAETIQVNPYPPIVLITELRIHNKPVNIGEEINGRVLLQKNLSLTDNITIKAIENDFSLDFVSLHYTNPAKHLYAYKLEGYHDDWIYLEKGQQSARFSNLKPGSYTFFVKATNGEGKWSEDIAQVRIEILPPWWESWWAYALYACLILLALWILRKITVKQQELKNKLVIEQIEHEKDKELNELKLGFFTKISHELRTPLTLILGPIEDLVSTPDKWNGMREKLTLVHKQTHKLLTLVNQLMDFRKADAKDLPLNIYNRDIISFIHELFLIFHHKAREQNIDYSFTTDRENVKMFYDPHKIEMVITNLLSNAFKYTPEGRKISVLVAVNGDPGEEAVFIGSTLKRNYLMIKVRDWGIGMNADELNKIFDFYYQAIKKETMQVMGTGVGLSLVKEIIDRHAGVIDVSSQPDEGTEFTIKLPFGKNHFPKTDVMADQPAISIPYVNEKLSVPNLSDQLQQNENISLGDFKILIVEDNEDVLQYLYKLLSPDMQVHLAHNGEEGWDAVLKVQPDLVLSDVMMHPMNGLEFCKKIKENTKTMHIPVCLLTARAATLHELEGLEMGADDYIVKPFIPKVLQARIFTILQNMQKKREYYQKQILLQPTEVNIPDEDRALLELSMKIVEENMEDPGFNVQILVKEMGMSQSAYYRKMKSITGQSVVEFIRDVRLKRAAQLLRESKMRVSQIAFMVGIEDMKYFRKVFRNVYQMSPSEYGKLHRIQEYDTI